jgi:hypothetical protein
LQALPSLQVNRESEAVLAAEIPVLEAKLNVCGNVSWTCLLWLPRDVNCQHYSILEGHVVVSLFEDDLLLIMFKM